MATESKPIELSLPCPSFELKGVDEKIHRLSDYSDRKILVIGFTCNHCPYVQAYEERLNALAVRFKAEAAFVCINANDDQAYPEDSFSKMKVRAKDLKFTFDYLRDETQAVARTFNAACTPEFFVYDEDRKLRYHGRLDDNHREPQAVKETYLSDAIDDLLAHRPLRKLQTSAIGCSIKWKNK